MKLVVKDGRPDADEITLFFGDIIVVISVDGGNTRVSFQRELVKDGVQLMSEKLVDIDLNDYGIEDLPENGTLLITVNHR